MLNRALGVIECDLSGWLSTSYSPSSYSCGTSCWAVSPGPRPVDMTRSSSSPMNLSVRSSTLRSSARNMLTSASYARLSGASLMMLLHHRRSAGMR